MGLIRDQAHILSRGTDEAKNKQQQTNWSETKLFCQNYILQILIPYSNQISSSLHVKRPL